MFASRRSRFGRLGQVEVFEYAMRLCRSFQNIMVEDRNIVTDGFSQGWFVQHIG